MGSMRLVPALLVLLVSSFLVSADSIEEANKAIRGAGAALGVLFFGIQGLKWATSNTPADRAEAKKGMIYVIIGLLFLKLAFNIVCGLYGAGVESYGVSCTVEEFRCLCTATT